MENVKTAFARIVRDNSLDNMLGVSAEKVGGVLAKVLFNFNNVASFLCNLEGERQRMPVESDYQNVLAEGVVFPRVTEAPANIKSPEDGDETGHGEEFEDPDDALMWEKLKRLTNPCETALLARSKEDQFKKVFPPQRTLRLQGIGICRVVEHVPMRTAMGTWAPAMIVKRTNGHSHVVSVRGVAKEIYS